MNQENSKSSNIFSFLINKRPVAWLIIIGLIISGTFSLLSIPREIQPEINIPFVAISVALPGASPSDTESLLTEPLEKQIANISEIENLSSTSGFGFSSVFIEFEADSDLDEKVQEVKDAASRAELEFPEDASTPNVQKAQANEFSIITFSIAGELPISELTKIAESVQNELEQVSGVSQVIINGGQKKYIEIAINQSKIEGYGLNILNITNILESENNNLPIGIVSSNMLNYSFRVDNRYSSLEEIRNVPLISAQTENFTPILLKDIAEVYETYPAQNIISKVSNQGTPARRAVSLQVFKKDDTNIVAIAENSRKKVEELKEEEIIPKNVEAIVSNDNSVYISDELGRLTSNGIQTALLITVVLFLALGLRQGILAGLSIPIIFLIAFTVLDYQGMTLNTLSLFSLVISLGLIVDTTIVIMEGIHENLGKGLSPKESALLSVETYKWPLIAGTLTTVFAFFPMLLVSGILGEFLATLPITITAALLGSLIVALGIMPSIASIFVKTPKKGDKGSILEPFFEKLGKWFHKFIHFIIKKRSLRFLTVFIPFILFALSLSLPVSGILKTQMFPQTDQNYFIINIETPRGIVIEETAKIAAEIENYLYDIPEIDNFVTKIGTSESVGLSGDIGGSAGLTESNLANITVNLANIEERERTSYEIADQTRNFFNTYTKAEIEIEHLSEGPPSDAPVTVNITGPELTTLQEIANQVENVVRNTEGTTNTKQSLEQGLNEFVFSLDRDILNYHGLSSIQVAALIRSIIQGADIDTITINGEEMELIAKYQLPETNNRSNISVHEIENFQIQSPKGYHVNLGQLGEYKLGESLSSIAREDQERIIRVTSDLRPNQNAVLINNSIEEKMAELEIAEDYRISFGGELEQIAESFRDLFRSMLVGILLISFTLVLMFNSFKQPLIILLTLPLALIGVFPGLKLIGLDLSFPAFLGVVALAGIVVNDAIVLIDRINKNRKGGMEFSESIAEAAQARLQPIVMTSITTIIGILPLALSNEFWAGLGFALVFGLATATFLTLFVIPVLYYAFEIRQERKRML